MVLIALTLGLLVLLFAIMVALARLFEGNSVADFLDWKPTRSPEVEAQNEVDDVQQMIDAQNELRRKRGAREITAADVERQGPEDQALRARGRGPFAGGWGDDEYLARALIVGCGCRGRELGAELAELGWQVRGTSRGPEERDATEAAGLEWTQADPDRPGTVLDLCGDVAVVVWLLGSAAGEA